MTSPASCRAFPLVVATAACLAGCSPPLYVPERASARAYPRELHTTDVIDIQVFRDETELELVNATPRSYHNVAVWVNQRFLHEVDTIPAGASIRLSLWNFFDERGERLNAGGFFRTRRADPVRLVQLQLAEDEPMIGLIMIVDDEDS